MSYPEIVKIILTGRIIRLDNVYGGESLRLITIIQLINLILDVLKECVYIYPVSVPEENVLITRVNQIFEKIYIVVDRTVSQRRLIGYVFAKLFDRLALHENN